MRLILILILVPLGIKADTVYSVDEWIEFYTRGCKPGYIACKESLEQDIGKMIAYSRVTFKYLDKEGLPRWLATVPIVESSYNEKAESHKGALGIWQIMPYNIERFKTKSRTFFGRKVIIVPNDDQVKKYGFNPIVSTRIAVFHLKNLYSKYSHLENAEKYVLWAYNAGEGAVNRFISGSSKLPTETINYYNKIMAIQHILKNMDKYGIEPVKQKAIFIDDYIKALVSMENEIERDHIHQTIAYILG